jgi:hypothetical protein
MPSPIPLLVHLASSVGSKGIAPKRKTAAACAPVCGSSAQKETPMESDDSTGVWQARSVSSGHGAANHRFGVPLPERNRKAPPAALRFPLAHT